MNLRKLILTQNECYKTGRSITPKGIMIHSTGADNPFLKRYVGPDDGFLGKNKYNNHWNQNRPDGRQVCTHAFIGKLDDGSIASYQTLPWNHRGWHCGGSANDTHIGIEICEDSLRDENYFKAVYNEAVQLCTYLCKMYRLSEKDILGHYEGFGRGLASNHGDPKHWFIIHGKSMDTFRTAVKLLLNSEISGAIKSENGQPSSRLHTVQKGETLWSISEAYLGKGSRYREIIKLNDLKSSKVHIGQKLNIPK